MSETILDAEPTIRASTFVGFLAATALWQVAAPRRQREVSHAIRRTNKIALVALDNVLLWLSFPILAVGLAVIAKEQGWGLFANLALPVWFAIIATMLVLVHAIYPQHVMLHAAPGLWRLHRIHNADLEFDATKALRFHPAEFLILIGVKLTVVAALGPPVVAVLLFEVILSAMGLFNRANIDLPRPVDRWLRLVVVTPDMHCVHHLMDPRETNSTDGFNLPWWDQLLGTYVAQPAKGQEGMDTGIEQFRTRRDLWLDRMLTQPLRGPASGPALDPRITTKETADDRHQPATRYSREQGSGGSPADPSDAGGLRDRHDTDGGPRIG